jgi:hypothetical protein
VGAAQFISESKVERRAVHANDGERCDAVEHVALQPGSVGVPYCVDASEHPDGPKGR